MDATAGTVWTAPGLPADLPVLTQIGIRATEPEVWGERALALEVPATRVQKTGGPHAPTVLCITPATPDRVRK